MSEVKQEPEDSAETHVPKQVEVRNIKHEVKEEKDAHVKVHQSSGAHICTCNHPAKDKEDKPKSKFNVRKFHRIYVEWNPLDKDIPEDRNGLVNYFSQWGPVQNSWFKLDEGLACIEYRGSQSVTKVQMSRPHGQTRTRRCHPMYYPAVRNVLFLAQNNTGENSPELLQHLGCYFGEIVHFATRFIKDRDLHLIFVTFRDYDSVDCLLLKLYLRMGSWKFYVKAVNGTVSLGVNGFPESYREPHSEVWEDFEKLIPENLPPTVVAAKATVPSDNNVKTHSNSCCTLTDNNDNLPPTDCSRTTANITPQVETTVATPSKTVATPSKTVADAPEEFAKDVDDDIQVLEIPRPPPVMVDLTEEDDQSNGDEADIRVEYEIWTETYHKDVIFFKEEQRSSVSAIPIQRKLSTIGRIEGKAHRNVEGNGAGGDNTLGAEEDDIIFLGEVVRHCSKCGGKIIVITLD